MQKRLAILIGGYPLTHTERLQILELRGKDTYFVAVDGGLNVFFELGILPDMLLGDMDSCSIKAYRWYCSHQKKQLFLSCDKDYLDMEAAINLIHHQKIIDVELYGVLGGRIDQTFSCLPFLLRGAALDLSITIKSEKCQMGVFKGPSENIIKTNPGDGWSFLAITKVVEGITLKGFKYKMENGTVFNTQTTALSNLAITSEVSVGINNGIIIYFNKPGRQ